MYIRKPIRAEVMPYTLESGLEDGFELLVDVVTKQWVSTEGLIKTERNGTIMCPYIWTRRGKTFIAENDYIVIEEDGTKLVCGGDKVLNRYEKVEE